jgi:hypothetical protein
VCFINMRGGIWGVYTPTCHHMKTLVTTFSSRPDLETLVAHEVLAHPRVAFHPCTCGLCGGTDAVAAALIGYDDMGVAVGMTMRRR